MVAARDARCLAASSRRRKMLRRSRSSRASCAACSLATLLRCWSRLAALVARPPPGARGPARFSRSTSRQKESKEDTRPLGALLRRARAAGAGSTGEVDAGWPQAGISSGRLIAAAEEEEQGGRGGVTAVHSNAQVCGKTMSFLSRRGGKFPSPLRVPVARGVTSTRVRASGDASLHSWVASMHSLDCAFVCLCRCSLPACRCSVVPLVIERVFRSSGRRRPAEPRSAAPRLRSQRRGSRVQRAANKGKEQRWRGTIAHAIGHASGMRSIYLLLCLSLCVAFRAGLILALPAR